MSYCLNLKCQKPHNPNNARFCSNCGSRLLLGDRYRALQPISQGGIGRTFLAINEQESTKPRCIIKQFSPNNQGTTTLEKALELFRKEVVRLGELGQHPQIPQLLAYFEPDSQTGMSIPPVLVQELIQGQSLAQQLETEGSFSEPEIQQILNELLPVLQFVHSHQVIHRDINPDNIIRRSSDLKLVLVDFSAAKFTTKTALARTGTVIGSAAYTAPEQLMGQAVPSSDLYSLGVTCIHLLTNIHPFDLFNHLEGVWVWQDYLIKPISSQLSQILNQMLDAAINKRYQSAEEILLDLNPQTNPKTWVQLGTAIKPSSSPPKTLNLSWRCIHTLPGHFSSINALAFSPDGTTLASGSADRTVKLWNIDSKIPRCSLSGHSSLVEAVVFSPDGRTLVSGSWDYTIKIWNVDTGELIHSLGEHSGWIKCLAMSADGLILASGSADKSIKIWDTNSLSVQTTLYGHTDTIHTLAISPDRQILASGGADKTIKIWNLYNGEVQLTLEGHMEAVHSLAFSPSGQILISGSADKMIKIWHLASGTALHTLTEHSDSVTSIAINEQGNILVSGSADKTVKIWHPGTGKLLQSLSGHSAGVMAVVISPDSRKIASGSQDKTVKIWQFE
ncbi:MAG TPA: serine/threonine-protein kinase [Coleofasciculaceae cyanobacterium]